MSKINENSFLKDLENELKEKHGDKEFQRSLDMAELELKLMMLIADERKLKNLTQKELGEELGVLQQQISKIENNKQSLTFPKLVEILDALDLRINIERKKDHKVIFHT